MSSLRGQPAAGRGPAERLAGRAVFAVALLAFLIIGIAVVGEFSKQWWLLILPVGLLGGSVLAAVRPGHTEGGAAARGRPWGE